jgi:hypothetical protein
MIVLFDVSRVVRPKLANSGELFDAKMASAKVQRSCVKATPFFRGSIEKARPKPEKAINRPFSSGKSTARFTHTRSFCQLDVFRSTGRFHGEVGEITAAYWQPHA